MTAARSLPPKQSSSAHPSPESKRLSRRVLTIVPDADDTSGAAAANARIEVAVCCAQADLSAIGRIFDALEQFDCRPMALTGVERDPSRMAVSVESAKQPRLYVVCKTKSVDLPQVRRMVRAFSEAKGRERHQLLVLEVDTDRVYAVVPKIRRGAETLRRRNEYGGPGGPSVAVDLPIESPALRPRIASPSASAVGRGRPTFDTSYALHRDQRDGAVDRTHVDVGLEDRPDPGRLPQWAYKLPGR